MILSSAATRVLILKSDSDAGASLRQHVLAVHSGACCTVVHTVAKARRAFAVGVPDLFVTGMDAPDGDPLDLLWCMTLGRNRPRHSLVVTRRREPWLLAALRMLVIGGVVDTSSDSPDNIGQAFREIAQGRHYWSLSLQHATAMPGAKELRLRTLSLSERLVFTAIGDGSDATAVGGLLGMRKVTVETTLKRLRAKVGAGSMGKLVALSGQYGFVRAAPAGTVRVGFGLLLAEYYLRSKRPLTPTPELRALYPEAAALAGRPRLRQRRRAA